MSTNKIGLNSTFHFGKYSNPDNWDEKTKMPKKLKQVIDEDVQYVKWCIINLPTFDINQEADEYFQEKIEEDNQKNNTPY